MNQNVKSKKQQQLEQEFQAMVKKASPNSNLGLDCLKAFVVGGFICCIGQFITNTLSNYGFSQNDTGMYTSIILIFIASLLTGLGLYAKIGKFAGAGSIVPITGFSNSVTSPALEFKKEGFILGLGAKIFTIAGPVILYGTLTSVVVGIIYYFVK
ncbi:MAG: stage V sporulation protein AC [Eubacteriales bacterium]|nr:stage V sporulation protein AC [Eubacteriales bacterium]